MRTRKINIVCQYLEDISRNVLEEHQALIRSYFRKRHGVYGLYKGKRLYYAGLASDLGVRLKRHLEDEHAHLWDRFSAYFTIGGDYLRELEALLIRVARPKGNRQVGRLPKSENLNKILRRDIKAFYRQKMAAILGDSAREIGAAGRIRAVAEGRTPVLAEYVPKLKRRRLRMTYRRKTFHAHVLRDGRIKLNRKTFTSPSLAAMAIAKRSMNGWRHWTFECAPGYWVPLDDLRR